MPGATLPGAAHSIAVKTALCELLTAALQWPSSAGGIITVDDAQWVDRESWDILHRVLCTQPSTSPSSLLVMASRPWAVNSVAMKLMEW